MAKTTPSGGTNWHEYFTADFEAGTLTWKPRDKAHFPSDRSWKIWNTQCAGKVAGGVNPQGYRVVCLFGRLYQGHRVLFEMANGPIPEGLQIDHIDQDKGNNALGNLRLATNAENMRNRGAYTNNTSGVKGVYRHKRDAKWVARISHHGLNIDIGRYATKGLAAVAYAKASIRLHGTFSTFTR